MHTSRNFNPHNRCIGAYVFGAGSKETSSALGAISERRFPFLSFPPPSFYYYLPTYLPYTTPLLDLELLGHLPGELGPVAAEVTVGGRHLVPGLEQIQVA